MNAYAMYLRKSRADDAAEEIAQTLAKHRRALDALAEKMRLSISEIFEEVVSGENLTARPQMLRLLEMVERGRFAGVLCMDIDRLGRGGMQDQGRILDAFRLSGTRIVTPDRTYDLTDECDEELTEFKAFFARREYKMIRKRMRRGLLGAVENGGYVANPPFGYRACRIGKKPSLEIVEAEAQFVRLTFSRYVAGEGMSAIAAALNLLGAQTRRGAPWSRSTVRYLLCNPVYAGKIRYRGDGKTPAILAEGLHTPIVSPEMWEAAARRRTGNSDPRAARAKEASQSLGCAARHTLTGLCRCGNCGRKMQILGRRSEKRLCCLKSGCIPSAAEARVEQMLATLLAALPAAECSTAQRGVEEFDAAEHFPADGAEKNALHLSATAAEAQAAQAFSAKVLAAEETDLREAAAARLRRRKERLQTLLEDGVYTAEEYRARMAAAEAELARLETPPRDRAANEETSAAHADPLRELLLESVACAVYRKRAGTPPWAFSLEIHLTEAAAARWRAVAG